VRFHSLEALIVSLMLLVASMAQAAGGGGGGGGGGDLGGGGSGPDPNEAYREGVELLAAGECKKADRRFRAVLKAVPRNPEANYLRGVAAQCQGKHKGAVKYFKRAIKYDASMYGAYQRLGTSYLELDELEDATEQAQRLRELRAECGESCSEKLIEAHDELEEAVQRKRAADGAADRVSPSEGGRQHALLFESISEPRRVYLTAVELIHARRYEEAIVELRALTASVGPVPDVLNYLGYAHRKLARFDASRRYYEQALALDPMHRGANEYLGELFVELGQIDLARERLAILDRVCPFGCAEYEDLKRRIESQLVAAR
jgi:tetratricopeptide (TPR) repeat protein